MTPPRQTNHTGGHVGKVKAHGKDRRSPLFGGEKYVIVRGVWDRPHFDYENTNCNNKLTVVTVNIAASKKRTRYCEVKFNEKHTQALSAAYLNSTMLIFRLLSFMTTFRTAPMTITVCQIIY